MAFKHWLQKRFLSLSGLDKLIDISAFGEPTNTGIHVSEQTAMKNTAVFACVRIISETIASLPLHTYRRLEPRGKERAADHPNSDLLHTMPNPEMNAFTFWELLISHLLTWGNFYAEIDWDMRNGRIRALWPLRPDIVNVERQNGQKIFTIRLPDGTKRTLPSFRVFHVPGLGFNGLVGFSSIRLHMEAIGLAIATEKYGAKFFGNGAKPGGVLETVGALKDDAHARLKKDWNDIHQGLDNAHRIAVLEQGMTFKQIGIPPEEAQFLQTRKFQIAEIARIYRMQLHKIQEMDAATFSNIEQQSIEHVVDTIRPWVVRIERAINTQLFLPDERKQFFAEFLLDGLLRGDTQSRFTSYATARQWGWLSSNDVRELENQNPIGEQGDIYLIPMNMMDARQVLEQPEPEDTPPGDEPPKDEPPDDQRSIEKRSAKSRHAISKRFEPLFKDAGQRIINREVADIKRAMKRFLGERNASDFLEFLEKFYAEAPQWISRTIRPTIIGFAQSIQTEAQDEVNAEANISEFVNEYIRVFAETHAGRSLGQIRKIVTEAANNEELNIEEEVNERLDEWQEKRADKIATTERIRGGAAFALATYAAVGIIRKIWRTFGRNCPFCNAMNGRTVGIEQNFMSKGNEFQPVGAEDRTPLTFSSNIKNPPLHAGCDCQIVPELGSRQAPSSDVELRRIHRTILEGNQVEIRDHVHGEECNHA